MIALVPDPDFFGSKKKQPKNAVERVELAYQSI